MMIKMNQNFKKFIMFLGTKTHQNNKLHIIYMCNSGHIYGPRFFI